jgi:hypothetical protein
MSVLAKETITSGWKRSSDEGGRVSFNINMRAVGDHPLQNVLKLRRPISASEITEESELMKLHLPRGRMA